MDSGRTRTLHEGIVDTVRLILLTSHYAVDRRFFRAMLSPLHVLLIMYKKKNVL